MGFFILSANLAHTANQMVFLDKLVIQRADDMQGREHQQQGPQQIFMNFLKRA